MLVGSARPEGLLIAAVLGYFLFQGILGTFAYHKLEPTAKKLKAKSIPLILGWVFAIIAPLFLPTYLIDNAIKHNDLGLSGSG